MKKLFLFAAALSVAACGAKPADKPAQRPATVKVGELAPEIKLEKVVSGGAAINGWADLKGKAVVMEFWGTYCDPCIENIPHLNDLAEKFKDKPVVFLSISRESERDVRDFLKEHELKGVVAADAPMAYKNYRVMGIPHTVLVDRDSRVVAVTYPAEVKESTIENLIAGKIAPGAASAAAEAPAPARDAKAYFSVAPSINGRSMRTSAGRLEMDGHTLAENIEKVVEPARAVEYRDVDQKLLGEKYALTVQIDPVNARRGGALRELGVAGLNSAFPLRIAIARKDRKVYLIKKAGSFPGALKETPGTGFSYSSGYSKSSQTKQIVAWSYDAKRASIAGLADALADWSRTPVLDETGLGDKGYVFAARFTSLDAAGLRAGLAPLGLKLEEGRRVVEVAEVTGKND